MSVFRFILLLSLVHAQMAYAVGACVEQGEGSDHRCCVASDEAPQETCCDEGTAKRSRPESSPLECGCLHQTEVPAALQSIIEPETLTEGYDRLFQTVEACGGFLVPWCGSVSLGTPLPDTPAIFVIDCSFLI